MKTCVLLFWAGVPWLLACCSPADAPADAPAASPATASPLMSWPERLHADYQHLAGEYHRMRAADSVLVADHQTARAVARDANVAGSRAFWALEKEHAALLARHHATRQQHEQLLRSYAELGYFAAAAELPLARLHAIHDSLSTEQQRLAAEYRSILADHEQMQAEHAALVDAAE